MHRLSEKELASLAEKWLDGTITPEEELLFNQWYEQKADPEIMLETGDESAEAFRERVLAGIRAAVRKRRQPVHSIRRWMSRAAAAAAVLLLAAGAYFWFGQRPGEKAAVAQAYDVAPGGNKAILTLANGTRIMLDSAHNGQLTRQGNSSVVKVDSGLLAYSSLPASPIAGGEEGTNILTTPKGGQYQIVLPDGTKVWLNAASSIKYPTAFTGKERRVEITGEAYFEVKHDDNMPFIVKAGDNIVRDIGTHFNIKAYTNEPVMKVTLLEGAVQVTRQSTHNIQVLKPGQEVQVSPNGQFTFIGNADTEGAIAWKEGRFNFQDADLQEVMRQLSRWYDIDVVYEKGIPDLEFIGEVQRSLPLSEVLKGLKMSGVNFRLEEGRRLLVFPR